MKRLFAFLLCIMMLMPVGCSCYRLEWNLGGSSATKAPEQVQNTPASEATQAAVADADTPAPTAESIFDIPITTPDQASNATATPYRPNLALLPITYEVKDEVGWDVSEALMFEYDIDFDGFEEEISFRMDDEDGTTTIQIDSEKIELDGSNLVRAILIDLDPETPYVNLLTCIDGASDDFQTTELHYTGGKIVKGVMVESPCSWDDEENKLYFYESTDILGTKSGQRTYSGEDLKPDTDWLVVSYRITEDDLRNDRDLLIEMGDLLHCTRDVPCEINGKPAKIAKGKYIYMVGFNDKNDTAEVCTEDGTTAIIHFTYKDWTYFIDGKKVEKYFDNLTYAD